MSNNRITLLFCRSSSRSMHHQFELSLNQLKSKVAMFTLRNPQNFSLFRHVINGTNLKSYKTNLTYFD